MTLRLVGAAEETPAQSAAALVHQAAEYKADAIADYVKSAVVAGVLIWLVTGGKLPKWLQLEGSA